MTQRPWERDPRRHRYRELAYRYLAVECLSPVEAIAKLRKTTKVTGKNAERSIRFVMMSLQQLNRKETKSDQAQTG